MGLLDILGLRRVATGGSLGASALPDKPFHLPVKSPANQQTFADRLDYVCKKRNAKYEIVRTPSEVFVRLHFYAEGVEQPILTLSGRGAKTPQAVADVLSKAEQVAI